MLSVLAVWAPPAARAALRSPQVPIVGGALQSLMNSLGESINVSTNQDATQFLIANGGTNSSFTLLMELGPRPAGAAIGVYDAAAAAPSLFEVFPPESVSSWYAAVIFRVNPARVVVNLFDESGVIQKSTSYFGGNKRAIGFYLEGPGGRFYSQDDRNPASDPQLLWFAGTGIYACTLWIAMEDASLSGDADADFDDTVLFVEGINYCPTAVQRSTWGAIKARFR